MPTTRSQVKAVAFDLFDTLITVPHLDPHEAQHRLIRCLREQGVPVEAPAFLPVYRDAVAQHRAAALAEGRETHNRFWISTALHSLGHPVAPDDPRIERTIEAYFSAFLEHAVLLPDTLEMLAALRPRYRLALLSNFTHGPAVRAILAHLGLTPLLEVVVISGEVGYRKPHRRVFDELRMHLRLAPDQIAFIGDDLEADVRGAHGAGLWPVWTTYARAYKASGVPQPSTPDGELPDTAYTIACWDDLLRWLENV
jgi:putative hydrolase of the HAD superfamily